jgi:2,5-diketo-D-gluconate reductase A
VADRLGVTPAQVVVRWHVEHEVVVIPKSATPERIESNFDVFGFSLDDEDVRRIDALSKG